MNRDDNTVAIFAALADPTRLKLLRLLNEQSESEAICVSALAMRMGISQPAVSQHLSVLKAAGLVKGERRGNYMHYLVKPEALSRCQEALAAALESLESELQPTGVDLCQGIPCPQQTNKASMRLEHSGSHIDNMRI